MKRLLALVSVCSWAVCGFSVSNVTAQSTSLGVTDHLTVPQWVNPKTPGELSGRIILPAADGSSQPIADATVVMTDRDGETVRGRTDDAGQFVISGVNPGVYALTARADGAFACCAMHVVSEDMASAEVLPREVEVAAAAIDYTIIKTAILRYLPPMSQDNPYTIANADLKEISSRVVGENLFRVSQSDGGLKGRIHVAGANGKTLGDAGLLNIFLVHKGEVIDRVLSNRNGTFAFEDIAPGEYSILAIGQTGLGMAGFELVDEALASQTDSSVFVGSEGRTLVAAYNDPCCCCCTEFAMQIAPLPQAIESFEEVIYEEPLTTEEGVVVDPAMDPAMQGAVDQFGNPIGGEGFGDPALGGSGALTGGGYGGGGFAGGGGGGGGFGGGLAGLAGLAAIAAVAGDDSDPLPGPAPPASPIR
ncbi:carboxypeptidase-like regulatory domain-containing protein [Rhodopirellula sallentina]|nr:carboxypeptidase-like regulatory domain-containing protein [Rhodopirellula sallentina]